MVEVTRFNFEEILPDIEESIKNASFIALDTEFTGLKVGAADSFSLFDSMEERYQKLKIRATSFTLTQIGLSAFKRHPSRNSYEVKTYVFYVRPYLCGNIDKIFMCQASCLDFLCRFDFDFNKVFKEGIPFMNETEVKKFIAGLDDERFSFPYNFLDKETDILINDTLLKPEKWTDKRTRDERGGKSNFSQKTQRTLQLQKDKIYPAYFQIIQLKNKYPSLSVYTTENEIILEKGHGSKKTNNSIEEKEKALNFCLGFTKVFRLLKEARKPIVGHNFLMDLLLFFHNFHDPLPDTFKKFKEELHSVFPVIFDNKQIWRSMRKLNILKKAPPQCGLFDLYELCKKPPSCMLALYIPGIEVCNGNKYVEGEFPHESGYDSYVTGYVFLNICHIIAMKKAKDPIFIEPQTFKQHLNAVEPVTNKVNLSRSRYPFIDLAGDDPSPVVPEYLYASKRNNQYLSEQELAVIFDKYGVIDVRLMSDKKHAVIAVASPTLFKEILTNFQDHEEFLITKYHALQHTSSLKTLLWLTVVGSVCAVAILITKLT